MTPVMFLLFVRMIKKRVSGFMKSYSIFKFASVLLVALMLTTGMTFAEDFEGEGTEAPEPIFDIIESTRYCVVEENGDLNLEIIISDDLTTRLPKRIEKRDSTLDIRESTITVKATSDTDVDSDFVTVDLTEAVEFATVYISGKKTSSICVITDGIEVLISGETVEKLKIQAARERILFYYQKDSATMDKSYKHMVDDACAEIQYGFVSGQGTLFELDTEAEIKIPYVYKRSSDVRLYVVEDDAPKSKKATYKNDELSYTGKLGLPIVVAEKNILKISGRTLDLQGTISLIFYAQIEGYDPQKTKMLFWTSPQSRYDEETAEIIAEAIGEDRNGYRYEYRNISSKEMSKPVYARLVTADDDGGKVYGAVPDEPYSVVEYADNMMKNENLKPLLIKMLNYGAAAQEYFGSDYPLANEGLTANQKATDYIKSYSSEDRIIEEDNGDKSQAVIHGTTLFLEGDISINYYTICPDDADEVGMLFWTENAYRSVKKHILGTESRKTVEYETNGEYKIFSYDNIVSREMYNSIYARLYTVKDGIYSYSDIRKYSVRDYAARQLAKNDDYKLSRLLRCLMLYGEEAKLFFDAN